MKKSTLLKKAKKKLARTKAEWQRQSNVSGTRLPQGGGGDRFICFAVCHAASCAKEREVASEIERDISLFLDGFYTYEQWLHWKGFRADFLLPENFKKLQLSRLAWMDAMIAHYESIGD